MVQGDEVWERLGFTPGEGKVYSAVLSSENATLQYIHEQTGLERRSVYDIINKMVNRGLVAYLTEGKHKIYRATDPKNMMAWYEEEAAETEAKKKALEAELPRLRKAFFASKPSFDARVYRGKEGAKALFTEMLGYKDHYFIGGNWGLIKYIGASWWAGWDRKRVEKGIRWHDLITSEPKMLAKHPLPDRLYEHKVLPPEFGSPNVIAIFGDRVANIYWSDTLFIFEINNRDIAENYLNYFRYLWKAQK